MIRHILLIATFAIASFVAQDDIPVKVLYEIAPGFPTTSFCERTSEVKYWMDTEAGNVRHVTIKGPIKDGETAKDVCNCYYRYLTQKNWLNGAGVKCTSQCGNLTMEITGKPDPTYNPEVKDKNLDDPMEELMAILYNTPTATPAGITCHTNCNKDADEVIHCTLICPRGDDTRTEDELCSAILGYYDQGNWLTGDTTSCSEEDGNIVVEFKGK